MEQGSATNRRPAVSHISSGTEAEHRRNPWIDQCQTGKRKKRCGEEDLHQQQIVTLHNYGGRQKHRPTYRLWVCSNGLQQPKLMFSLCRCLRFLDHRLLSSDGLRMSVDRTFDILNVRHAGQKRDRCLSNQVRNFPCHGARVKTADLRSRKTNVRFM